MPRKYDLNKLIIKQLKANKELFRSVPRSRKALIKQFATSLAEVLGEYETKPLDYDKLVEIRVKIGTRLLSSPPWSDYYDYLFAQIKLYSQPHVYDKPRHIKETLLNKELGEEARKLREAGFLSCWRLAEIQPQAYMLLIDIKP